MKKTVAIALFALGLFGVALFATAVRMARARMEESTADTVSAIRTAQRGSPGSTYIAWPDEKGRGGR